MEKMQMIEKDTEGSTEDLGYAYGVEMGRKLCPNCLAVYEKDESVCGECGNRKLIFAPEGIKYCLTCGMVNGLEKPVCTKCSGIEFVYTQKAYQEEIDRQERERIAEELRILQEQEEKEQERLLEEEREREEAARKEQEQLAAARLASTIKRTAAKADMDPVFAVILAIMVSITAILYVWV